MPLLASAGRKSHLPLLPSLFYRKLTRVCSYRPDILLRFISEELHFDSDEETVNFFCKFEAGEFLTGGGHTSEPVKFSAPKAAPLFEQARRAAFGLSRK